MKAKNLKKSFLLSVLSLVLCVSMFVGTTFAWFTDSITNTNNKIMAGKLYVELYFQVEGSKDWVKVDEDTNIFMKDALWEPGHTEVVKLKVVNEGSLALKYQLGVNIADETGSVNQLGDPFKLSHYILYDVLPGEQDYADRDEAVKSVESSAKAIQNSYTNAGELEAGKESISTMVVYMPTATGNEANAQKGAEVPTIHLGLNLYATQVANEEDSFNNEYDKDIALVGTADELRSALEAGGEVILTSDVALDSDDTITIPVGTETTLNLGGHTVSGTSEGTGANRNMIDVRGTLNVADGTITTVHTGTNMGWGNSTNVINITAGGVVNLENVEIKNLGGSDMAFGIHLNNWGEVTLNVNNSTIFGTYTAVRVFNSGNDMNNVNITNSTLMGGSQSFWVHNYTLADFGNSADKVDAHKALLNFNFIIDNPNASVAAGDTSNLVAEANNTFVGKIRYGFTNGEIYYYTTDAAVASSNESISSAINAGAATVYLGSGNYTVPAAKGKTLTFVGSGDTTLNVTKGGGEGARGELDGSKVVFENLTINTDSKTYTGYARMNATYNNCVINGTYTLYGDSVFNDCTFNVTGDVYNIWTWGAPTATFNNCTFNSDGKAMLLYGTVNTELTLNNCVFNDGGAIAGKAAVETGDDYSKSYKLVINNIEVNGFDVTTQQNTNRGGTDLGTNVWGNKNLMTADKLDVIIDGVEVY